MSVRIHCALIVAFLFVSVSAPAAEEPARFLVHLLSYIGADYPGAVKNGKVISQSEYQEQKEFVQSAVEKSALIPELANDAEFKKNVQRLKSLVETKGAGDDVG